MRGTVCVTRELAQGVREPVALIANGADPASVPSFARARERAAPRGVRRIARPAVARRRPLLDLARALPGVDFDLVGPRAEGAPANVTQHGTLAGEAYGPCSGGRMSPSAAWRWSGPASGRARR